jgi:chromosome segregation ATPase
MTLSLSTSPDAPETAEILRFLHRFADLMSSGGNSENLLRAAQLLEAHIDKVKESNELLQVERIRGDENSELRKTLEGRLSALEGEIALLRSQLSESELKLNDVSTEAEKKQGELLNRAEQAEAQLAAAQSELASRASSDTHILVPVAALRLAKSQFESLARAFEKVGNIVSQTMCDASASSLDRVLIDAGALDSGNRSKHAA